MTDVARLRERVARMLYEGECQDWGVPCPVDSYAGGEKQRAAYERKADRILDALAAREGEPVAERISKGTAADWWWNKTDCPVGTKLYAHPPVEPAREGEPVGWIIVERYNGIVQGGRSFLYTRKDRAELDLETMTDGEGWTYTVEPVGSVGEHVEGFVDEHAHHDADCSCKLARRWSVVTDCGHIPATRRRATLILHPTDEEPGE